MPKSASTSIERALTPHCGFVVTDPPSLKHANYKGFMRLYAPILRKKCSLPRTDYEVVCIMREPISWLNSWYRYRSREGLARAATGRRVRYTGGMTFPDFLEAYLQDTPPPFARVGDPFAFVTQRNGRVGVDRIFKFEELESFRRYISTRLKVEITIPTTNVSPTRDYDVPGPLLARVREKLGPAIRLYESL
jgi:hypothetical protein